MKRLSLNQKIALILSILVIGSIVIGSTGLLKISQINGILLEITDVHVKRDQMTSQMLDLQRQVSIYNKDIIIERSMERMNSLEGELGKVRSDLLKTVEQYTTMASPEGKKLASEYLASLTEWMEVNKEVRRLTKAGRDAEVETLVKDKETPLRLQSLKSLQAMNDLTAEKLVEAKATAAAAYQTTKYTMLLISIGSVALSLFIAFIIMRAVSRAINQVISSLNDNSSQVTAAAQQIASSSQELSQAASEQAAALQETASSIEEMRSMIQRSSENAENVTVLSAEGQKSAGVGKQAVADMIQSIEDINASNVEIMQQTEASNQRISEIVQVISEIGNKTKVINDIVFQTKLLSFNASVEAARAGEHGKGFAVVAEEVGNLAQMSGNAAKEISGLLEESIHKVETIVEETKSKIGVLIDSSRHKVEHGAEVARRCGTVLDEIVDRVSQTSQRVSEISTAGAEQTQGIQEITRAMSQLDQVTQTNAATSEEAASAAEELSAQADSLRSVVGVLIQTIRGESASADQANPFQSKRTNIKASKQGATNVTHLKDWNTSGQNKTMEFKKAAGDDLNDPPQESDPRFKDV